MIEAREESTAGQKEAEFFKRYGGTGPENYQRFFVPSIGGPLAHDLIALATLRPDERVLDVACGTGAVTRLAKERVASGNVAGLDINPGMLEVARKLTPPGVSIDWHQASAENMPLASDAFDVVLCQLGLQFVADKAAALQEMRRVLARSGRLVLSVVGPIPRVFGVMHDALERHVSPESARFVKMVFSLDDESVLERLIRAAEFSDVVVQTHTKELRLPTPAECLWQYVWSTPLAMGVAKLDDERKKALEAEVVTGWRAFVDEGRLVCEVPVLVATAKK